MFQKIQILKLSAITHTNANTYFVEGLPALKSQFKTAGSVKHSKIKQLIVHHNRPINPNLKVENSKNELFRHQASTAKIV